jgi:hypothetical protein
MYCCNSHHGAKRITSFSSPSSPLYSSSPSASASASSSACANRPNQRQKWKWNTAYNVSRQDVLLRVIKCTLADYEDVRMNSQCFPVRRKDCVLITQSLSALFRRGNEYKTPVTLPNKTLQGDHCGWHLARILSHHVAK